ncbi:MAG: hypothetical protein WAL25_04000 [Acidimicrobiia bacterium]
MPHRCGRHHLARILGGHLAWEPSSGRMVQGEEGGGDSVDSLRGDSLRMLEEICTERASFGGQLGCFEFSA